MTDIKDVPFEIRLFVKQVVGDGKLLNMRDVEEFSFGKDLMPTLANMFNNMKIFIDKKLPMKVKDIKVMTS